VGRRHGSAPRTFDRFMSARVIAGRQD
jgi:hypothetical protein